MRVVLFHAKRYATGFHSYANRPQDIVPENIEGKERQECSDCIVALVTAEKRDNQEQVVNGVVAEIEKMSQEIKRSKFVIIPFAHLSNNLAPPSEAFAIIQEIEKCLRKKSEVLVAHFGSNKELLLDIYGHAGNARYREF